MMKYIIFKKPFLDIPFVKYIFNFPVDFPQTLTNFAIKRNMFNTM